MEELLLSIQEHEGPLPSAAVQSNVATDGDDDRHGNLIHTDTVAGLFASVW